MTNKVIIALLDTGVDYNYPNVAINLVRVPKCISIIEANVLDSIAKMQEELITLKSHNWVEQITMNMSGYSYRKRLFDINQIIQQNQNILDKTEKIRRKSCYLIAFAVDFHLAKRKTYSSRPSIDDMDC